MNGHFVYPPPGLVFVPVGYNGAGGYFVPPHSAQPGFAQYGAPYSPSSQTSHNGAYPPFAYPPPYMNPGAPPFHSQHPYPPYLPPPGTLGPPGPAVQPNYGDRHVFYHSQPQQHPLPLHPPETHVPDHPPGLPIPHRSNVPPAARDPPSAIAREHDEINQYWRGRLAPLPGYRSEPVLLPPSKAKTVEQDGKAKESHDPEENNRLELLPPTSSLEQRYHLKNKSKNRKINGKKEKEKEKEFQFDKFAAVFVQQYLMNIQLEKHELKPLPALPIFPPESFLQSFLSPSLIDSVRSSDSLHALLSSPPLGLSEKMPALELEVYRQHWADILRWELEAMTLEKEHIVLWKTPVKVESWSTAEFKLVVPGIRENYPYLEIGDLVHMREVLENEMKGTLKALEGRVVALRKREGLVHISSQPLKEHIQTFVPSNKIEEGYYAFGPKDDIPLRFNITFMMNGRPLCLMDSAVATVSKMLDDTATEGTPLARHWIFPDPQDFSNSPPRKLAGAEIKESHWVDSGLNVEQRLAVSAVALCESPFPHLISGPPGTGKTRTVVEAVLQIFRVRPEACILVCAPSNPATDTLVLRLQTHLRQHEMLRLNNPHRTFAEVPGSIRHYCYVENNVFSIPPWKKLMQYRVVVCSCLDASILVAAQCTNSTLMALEEETMSAIHPCGKPRHVAQPHWTHLLIDEAAQGSEPELLIPISVVLPHPSRPQTSFMPQLTLCGDINQLGPLVASDEARAAEFEMSLLERLFERPLYSNFSQLQNSSGFVQPNGHNVNVVLRWLPPYTHLIKNYRSHPAILMPPSTIFYNDTLQPCAKNGVISWKGLPNPKIPLKFVGDNSPEDTENERASWFNLGQVRKIVDVIKSLINEAEACQPPLRAEEIGVMAPWRDQVLKLRNHLRDAGLRDVDVGTIEDYQGREIRVVIISCVRSNARFLDEDRKKGLGLVLERKRMNVAITRAKELLVVVGNADLLCRHDPYWKGFLQFALRHKLYEGPEFAIEMDGNYISKLESQILLSQTGGLELDAEEQGVAVAGVAARQVLRD